MRARRWFRVSAIFGAAFTLTGAAWMPGKIQTAIVDRLLEKINKTTPYQVRIDSASGDFIRHIVLNGVHISARGESTELVQASVLDLSIKWTNLLHKRLELRSLKLIAPTLHLTLGSDGQVQWPKSSQAPEDDSSFAFYINHIEVTQGKVVFLNQSTDKERRLTLTSVELAAGLSPERIDIQKLSVALERGNAVISGQVNRKEMNALALNLQTSEFPIHRALGAVMAVPAPLRLTHSGRWTISGDRRAWNVRTQGTLDGASLTATVRTNKEGYSTQVQLSPLALRTLWRDPNAGRMGVLSASFTATSPQWTSSAVDASGVFRIVQPSSGVIQAPVAQGRVQLARGRGTLAMNVSAQGLAASATAELNLAAKDLDGLFNVELENFEGLAEWAPALKDAQGALTAKGSLKGSFTALATDVTAHGDHFRYGSTTIGGTQVTVAGRWGNKQTLTVDGSAKTIVLNDPQESAWDMNAAEFHLTGQPSAWKAKTDVQFRNKLTFNYTGSIQQNREGWQFLWDTLALSPKKGPNLHSTHRGEAVLESRGTLAIHRLGLTTGQGTLDLADGRFGPHDLELQLSIKDVALASLASVVAPEKKCDGLLNAEVQFHGALESPSGSFRIRVSTGVLQNWSYREFAFTGHVASPWITIEDMSIRMAKSEQNITGHGKLPLHLIDSRQPEEPIALHLDAPHLDLLMLTAAIPGLVIDKGGDAAIVADITGRADDPDVTGRLTAHFPHLRVPQAGLDVHDFAADIGSQGKKVHIASFEGKTKKGEFHMTGESVLPALQFNLVAQDLQLEIPKELKARLNANLVIAGDLEGPDVSGDIRINEGTYTQPQKTKKQKAKEAAEQNDPPEPSPLWEGTTLNVHVDWWRNVWYRDGLTKIETTGDVRIQKDQDALGPYMTGRMSIIRGSYDAYGRDFVLNSGDVLFTGPPEINPALNIEASYSGGGTQVYLDVKGTAKEPQVTLRSDPPLAQQDIVSVLIFGHPLNQINAGGASDQTQSEQAQAAAGSVLGGYLTKSLRESGMNLGLDVVRVDASNTGGNRLTVGRYIGDRLFVSYGQPIQGNAVRVFNANYYLSSHWALVGETGAGTDSFLDLLFRYPLNKPAQSKSTGFVPTSNPFLTPTQALPFPTANPVAH
jgi:autotransporter translocation and assembly factor TamB